MALCGMDGGRRDCTRGGVRGFLPPPAGRKVNVCFVRVNGGATRVTSARKSGAGGRSRAALTR